jgi:hypothetical protein
MVTTILAIAFGVGLAMLVGRGGKKPRRRRLSSSSDAYNVTDFGTGDVGGHHAHHDVGDGHHSGFDGGHHGG